MNTLTDTTPEPAGSTRAVYVLLDPVSGAVRYVGQAADAAARVRRHWADSRHGASGLVHAWLRTLDEPPSFQVLADVPETEALAAEARHIRRLRRSSGARLLNLRPYEDVTELPGVDPAVSGRMATALTRPTWSETHYRRVSAALTGHPVSAETRARISAATRGRPKSAAHRAKIAAGVTTWHASRRQALAEAS